MYLSPYPPLGTKLSSNRVTAFGKSYATVEDAAADFPTKRPYTGAFYTEALTPLGQAVLNGDYGEGPVMLALYIIKNNKWSEAFGAAGRQLNRAADDANAALQQALREWRRISKSYSLSEFQRRQIFSPAANRLGELWRQYLIFTQRLGPIESRGGGLVNPFVAPAPVPESSPLRGFGAWYDWFLGPLTPAAVAISAGETAADIYADSTDPVTGEPRKGIVQSAAEGFGTALGQGITSILITATVIGAAYYLFTHRKS